MIKFGAIIFLLIVLVQAACLVSADRLPNASSTNNFNLPTVQNLQLVGMMDEQTSMEIYNQDFPNGTNSGFLTGGRGAVMSDLVYKTSMMTNGGYLNQAKDQTYDEGSQTKGSYNVDSAMVTTYAADPEKASKMSASEKLTLTTSGNFSPLNDSIHNALVATIADRYIGGFNSNYAVGSDVTLTTGQLATIAKGRSVGVDDTVPAEVDMTLGIHPDSSTGLPYAEGKASTDFRAANEEGYRNTTDIQSTKTVSDSTTVEGMIFHFGKDYVAKSGVEIG
jgi:hypothetical protein